MNANTSVFKGGVTERGVSNPQEISQIKKNGLASPAPSWAGRSLGIKDSVAEVALRNNSDPRSPLSQTTEATSSIDVSEIGDDDTNMKQIMKMSPQELQDAHKELISMFKPKNLEFLQRTALQKFGNLTGKTKNSTLVVNKDYQDDKDKVQMNKKSATIDSDIDIQSVKDLGQPVLSSMAANSRELKELQLRASVEHRANFAWAIDDDEFNNVTDGETEKYPSLDRRNVCPQEKGTNNLKQSAKSKKLQVKTDNETIKLLPSNRVLIRSSRDRFDLRGCKVIEKEGATNDISIALKENSYIQSWNLKNEDVHSIARVCVESLLFTDFVVEHVPSNDMQPQDELLNHQMEPTAPGYNMTEICEFYRSENPAQRLLGLKMLQGILRKRDQAVCLESYFSSDWNRNPNEREMDKENKEMKSFGKKIVLSEFEILQDAFKKVLLATVAIIVNSIIPTSLLSFKSQEEEYLSNLRSSTEQAKLRRVLVYSLLTLCASDLPTGLPTLLVWGIKQPRLSPVIALNTLLCLRDYISSSPEESAAEKLWDSMWGTAGCPSLPMAHARRAEVSYEVHIEDCFDNRRSVFEEEEERSIVKEEKAKKPPMYESFALRCRWGRVDNLISEGNIVDVVCNFITAGANILQNDAYDINDYKDNDNNDYSSDLTDKSSIRYQRSYRLHKSQPSPTRVIRDAASSLTIQAAFIASQILYSLCRLCDKDHIDIVLDGVKRIWTGCLILLNNSEKGGLSCGWWKILSEAARRRRNFAVWMCEDGQESMVAKCLISVLKSVCDLSYIDALDTIGNCNSDDSNNTDTLKDVSGEEYEIETHRQCWDSVVWSLRLWQVCTAYGLGLESVSELMLAAQLDRPNRENVKFNMASGLTGGGIDFDNKINSNDKKGGDDTPSQINMTMALSLGPGLLTQVASSPHRLTAIFWLLEQASVTCAAIIDLHTIKLKERHLKVAEDKAKDIRKETRKMSEVEEIEEKKVGQALETTRLLLGVAERLFPSLIVFRSSHYFHSFQLLLRSASVQFLASLLGTWSYHPAPSPNQLQTDRSSSRDEVDVNSSSDHNVNPYDKELFTDDGISDYLDLNILEICSMRQLYTSNSDNVTDSGENREDGDRRKATVGLGLLQSALEYSKFMRITSTTIFHIEEDITGKGEKKTVTNDTIVAQEENKKVKEPNETQSAILRHLESKILLFISTATTEASLFSIETIQSSLSNEIDKWNSQSISLLPWMLFEESISWNRLVVNIVSYVKSRLLLSSQIESCNIGFMASKTGEKEVMTSDHFLSLAPSPQLILFFSKRQEKVMSVSIPTSIVAEGLFAWQVNRVKQLLCLSDLQILSEGVDIGVLPRSLFLQAAVKCLQCLGQGMKRSVVLLVQVILRLIISPKNISISDTTLSARHKYNNSNNCDVERYDYDSFSIKDKSTLRTALGGRNITPFSDLNTTNQNNLNQKHQEEREMCMKVVRLRSKMLFFLLGSKKDADRRISYGDSAVILGGTYPPKKDHRKIPKYPQSVQKDFKIKSKGLGNLCDWRDDYHDSKLPVPTGWPLRALEELSGEDFVQWLVALVETEGRMKRKEIQESVDSKDWDKKDEKDRVRRQENARNQQLSKALPAQSIGRDRISDISASKPDSNFNHDYNNTFSILHLSSAMDNLYNLLRLACPDQSHRWVTLTPAQEGEGNEEEVETCFKFMTISDSSPIAVSAYCSLMAAVSSDIALERDMKCNIDDHKYHNRGKEVKGKKGSKIGSNNEILKNGKSNGETASLCEQFVIATQKEVTLTQGLMSKNLRRGTFGFGIKTEGGAMELCGKLLEGAMGQQISTDVHCLSLLALLSPSSSPWRVRERVWRHLGEVRLLHLIENTSLIYSMIGLLNASEIVSPVCLNIDDIDESSSNCNDRTKGNSNRSSTSDTDKGDADSKEVVRPGFQSMTVVSRSIIATLSNLRGDNDKDWLICSIGLYHIAASMFSVDICTANMRSKIAVSSAQYRLLQGLLSDKTVPDWIITGTFLTLDSCYLNSEKSEIREDTSVRIPAKKFLPEYHRKRIELNESSSYQLKNFQFLSLIIILENFSATDTSSTLFDFIKSHRPHLFA